MAFLSFGVSALGDNVDPKWQGPVVQAQEKVPKFEENPPVRPSSSFNHYAGGVPLCRFIVSDEN